MQYFITEHGQGSGAKKIKPPHRVMLLEVMKTIVEKKLDDIPEDLGEGLIELTGMLPRRRARGRTACVRLMRCIRRAQ